MRGTTPTVNSRPSKWTACKSLCSITKRSVHGTFLTIPLTFRTSAPSRGRSGDRVRSLNLLEVAVPAKPILEAARAGHTIRDQCLASVVPFLNQRLAHAKPVTLDCRAAIGAHTDLREARDLPCQLLRLCACAALGGEVFAQADGQALLRWHFPSRKDDLQCTTLADDPRQPHGSAVYQRHTPTAAIDPEVGFLRHHPEIAP